MCLMIKEYKMNTKIQFQKNATVLVANGQKVGTLHRIVVNPKNNVLTNIVVRTGTLLSQEEKVVPIDLVAEAGPNQIILHNRPGILQSLPPFEEERIIEENVSLDGYSSPEDMPLVMFGRANVGLSNIATPVIINSDEYNDQFVTQIEQNIPVGTVAVKEGAKVITAEGKHAGNVESVLADPSMDRITHLLVSNGLLTREKKLLPIHWVTVLGEDEIRLGVKKSSVDELMDVSEQE
jgi:uncharacterized protein YrrD